jgi:hypothetical protein
LPDFLSTIDEAQADAQGSSTAPGTYYASRENQGCL